MFRNLSDDDIKDLRLIRKQRDKKILEIAENYDSRSVQDGDTQDGR